MQQLTLFAEEPLAILSASPDSEKGWTTHVATSASPILQLLTDIGPFGWYLKMYLGFYRQMMGKIFNASWMHWSYSDTLSMWISWMRNFLDWLNAVGNSMAVPVVRWIGERIRMVDR